MLTFFAVSTMFLYAVVLYALSMQTPEAIPLLHYLVRDIFRNHPPNTNPFVAVVDSPLYGPLAYTATDKTRVYIDGDRLAATPNTMYNVLRHEIAHSQGQEHGNATVEMRYAARVDQLGRVLEDDTRI